jgi:dienelactone hydrolase
MSKITRRDFFQHAGIVTAGGIALSGTLPELVSTPAQAQSSPSQPIVFENVLGEYGPWAKKMLEDAPAKLSFLRDEFNLGGIDSWRKKARLRLLDCLAMPDSGGVPKAQVLEQVEFEGLTIQHLQWELPYGPPTKAMFLKPSNAKGKLPAILALHDHSGKKYFGHQKISCASSEVDSLIKQHVDEYYEGVWWANQMARRGYAVLVPDAFLFGSRRIRLSQVPRIMRGLLVEGNPDNDLDIVAYNRWASQHEHDVAKSLLCAGTTMPGVVVADDQRALDYLCSREDVDVSRIGCCGLSSGGLRTLFLAGLDDRIAAACCVGMMTTWRDLCLNKSYTHTWMIYPPGFMRDLDYPEILGLRVPLPIFVQNAEHDQLFTLSEVQRADRMLADIYKKAGAESQYKSAFYPGTHRFDLKMQEDAFTWLDSKLLNSRS